MNYREKYYFAMSAKRHVGGGTELGKRIDALRRLRNETQSEFARRLGVNQGTVSAWIRGDKSRKPSAEMIWRLSSLATDPADILWFLEQTGLSVQAILAAARKIHELRYDAPPPGSTVNVMPLHGAESQDALLAERKRVPNPDHTFYTSVDVRAADFILAPGLVTIDVRYRGTLLAPFWEDIVLVHIDPEKADGVARSLYADDFLGRVWLHVVLDNFDVPGRTPGLAAVAMLGGVSLAQRLRALTIGRFFHPDWRKPEFLERVQRDDKFARRAIEEMSDAARKDMQTDPGIEIVGRVLRWDAQWKPPCSADEGASLAHRKKKS